MSLSKPLLAWFAKHKRDLPWRLEPREPYRVWISEVMLQQTRVDVVVPYYTRFLTRFPTLRSLAEAPLDDVLAHWSGLGYYSRARNLHRAAQEALARFGQLPRSLDDLHSLPGFGPYTAAAVASLSMGIDAALVDGNVARVFARLFALEGSAEAVREQTWEFAPHELPKGKAGVFNEALMELGATVCTPRSPSCDRCPLKAQCKAFALGDPERFPPPKVKKARPIVRWSAVALRDPQGRVLLARHTQGSLFEGLWALPFAEQDADHDAPKAAREALRKRKLTIPRTLTHTADVAQTLTHRELQVAVFTSTSRAIPLVDDALRWVEPTRTALAKVGLSSLAKKTLAACDIPAP
ncbi:MAG: A/G-specific adenine glycosylase [Deltaproteobacteria bacterium]|nr:A/G-specific adenine glycosylase [Deltaproteobacteria bacterium]